MSEQHNPEIPGTGEVYLNGKVTLLTGDCRDMLKTLPDNSIDSCVSDPPYSLVSIVKRFGGENAAPAQFGSDGRYARASRGFMGKSWDTGEVAFDPAFWAEVYRVLKPGGHVLAMGGTRTYHRLACGIEDAGFEIRDQIGWLYATGFPKSHSINKNLEGQICACGQSSSERHLRSVRDSDVSQPERYSEERWQVLLDGLSEQGSSADRTQATPRGISAPDRLAESCLEGRRDIPKTPRELRLGEVRAMSTRTEVDGEGGRLCNGTSAGDSASDRPNTDAGGMCASPGSQPPKQSSKQSGTMAGQPEPQVSRAWDRCGRCGKPVVTEGLGTALKPAWEPICVARKPLSEKTVAANVLTHGTGALNIYGCRVGTEQRLNVPAGNKPGGNSYNMSVVGMPTDAEARTVIGRWPANLIHDGSEEAVGAFPSSGPSKSAPRGSVQRFDPASEDTNRPKGGNAVRGHDDVGGSAARFFYSAKASKKDRAGSKHPTVKPISLMQYLIRLVTPPGGVVLDPFAGSGTTGEAAWREGMRCVLIEREAEYQDDIRRRLKRADMGEDELARVEVKADVPDDAGPLFATSKAA